MKTHVGENADRGMHGTSQRLRVAMRRAINRSAIATESLPKRASALVWVDVCAPDKEEPQLAADELGLRKLARGTGPGGASERDQR
jgi:hypothetical protein